MPNKRPMTKETSVRIKLNAEKIDMDRGLRAMARRIVAKKKE